MRALTTLQLVGDVERAHHATIAQMTQFFLQFPAYEQKPLM